jgi:glycosyltransferase involved in cell wall biosynthesis
MSKRLIVAIEHHFHRYNRQVYTDIAFAYEYWHEYLDVFDEVTVLARVRNIEKLPEHLRRADGEGVSFIDLPDYYGPWQFVKVMPLLFARCFKPVARGNYILLRMGNIATCVWLSTRILRRDYAIEFVGDPNKSIVHAKQTSSPFVDWMLSRWMHFVNRLQSRGACCASYVSKYIHKLYPTKHPDREFVFSGVCLSRELITLPRAYDVLKGTEPTIVSVGRLMPEKGHRILVEAADRLRQLRSGGWQIKIAGKGPESQPLQELIDSLQLQKMVKLLGVVKWGPDLFKLLDNARLFVLPSLTEGMPRALIEAMARGMPAIASRSGGIIELLDDDDLVESGDANMLAEQINLVLDDIAQLEQMSRRNFQKAMEYKPEIMQQRKNTFWKCICKYTRVR